MMLVMLMILVMLVTEDIKITAITENTGSFQLRWNSIRVSNATLTAAIIPNLVECATLFQLAAKKISEIPERR